MLFHKFLRPAAAVLISFTLTQAAAAQTPPETEPARGSLRWWAQKARSEGKSEMKLPTSTPLYPDELDTLEIAIMDSTVVVAKLLENKTVADDRDIFTWRKYRIVEFLSNQSRELPPERDEDWEREFAMAPKSMLPVTADEFLMADYGGTTAIDGVKITVPGNGTQELPVGSRHLMFVLFGSARKVAQGCYGPTSYFTIDDSETVHARFPELDSDRNSLLQEIRERANGNLAGLRSLAAIVTKSH